MSMKLHEFTAIVVVIMIVAWIGFTALTPGLYAAKKDVRTEVPLQAAAGAPSGQGAQTGPDGGGANPAVGAQKVIQLKVVNGYYEPRVITVKQGDRVKLDLDAATFRGCMSVFNIWGIKERVLVSPDNHVVEFTADKAGTYRMSCPMGMGNGQLVVQTTDGKTVVAAPGAAPSGPSGGSCGMGGGCGCGMMG